MVKKHTKSKVPSHIKDIRKTIDHDLSNDPIRRIDKFFSHEGTSGILTILLLLLMILVGLGGGVIVVIYIF